MPDASRRSFLVLVVKDPWDLVAVLSWLQRLKSECGLPILRMDPCGLWGKLSAAAVGGAIACVLLALRRLPSRDWIPARWSGLWRSWSMDHERSRSRGRRSTCHPAVRSGKGLLVRLGGHGGGDKGCEKDCDDDAHKPDVWKHCGFVLLSPAVVCCHANPNGGCGNGALVCGGGEVLLFGFSAARRTISTVFRRTYWSLADWALVASICQR